MEHMQDLKDHPDVTSIEAVVEHVPPSRGRRFHRVLALSLVTHGFLEGVLRMAEILSSPCVHRSGKRD